MAILKDADALDRCRLFDLNPRWLRYPESRYLIKTIEEIYFLTRVDEEGIEWKLVADSDSHFVRNWNIDNNKYENHRKANV